MNKNKNFAKEIRQVKDPQLALTPTTHIPGLGTGIGTDSLGTHGTGTNIAG